MVRPVGNNLLWVPCFLKKVFVKELDYTRRRLKDIYMNKRTGMIAPTTPTGSWRVKVKYEPSENHSEDYILLQ